MIERDELRKALELMGTTWPTQDDKLDNNTNFINKAKTVDEITSLYKNTTLSLYALHRWYNFNCAKHHEAIFIRAGARPHHEYNHPTIDFYLLGVSYDLKSTVLSNRVRENRNYNLLNRNDKNDYIVWLYNNQSRESRHHEDNRIFIVCNDLAGKLNFEAIEKSVKLFMKWIKQNGLNSVTIQVEKNNELVKKQVYSDIIWIS